MSACDDASSSLWSFETPCITEHNQREARYQSNVLPRQRLLWQRSTESVLPTKHQAAKKHRVNITHVVKFCKLGPERILAQPLTVRKSFICHYFLVAYNNIAILLRLRVHRSLGYLTTYFRIGTHPLEFRAPNVSVNLDLRVCPHFVPRQGGARFLRLEFQINGGIL